MARDAQGGAPGRRHTVVVTASASSLGVTATRALGSCGARVVTVDRVEADVIADLGAPWGRSAMVHEVAAFTGGVVDAVVVPVGRDGVPCAVEHLYFAPVAAAGGLRSLLAGSARPRAVLLTAAGSREEVDARLVAACLDGDEARAIELADRRLAGGDDAVVLGSCRAALHAWVARHAGTREWAGRGIPLVVTDALDGAGDGPLVARLATSPLGVPRRGPDSLCDSISA